MTSYLSLLLVVGGALCADPPPAPQVLQKQSHGSKLAISTIEDEHVTADKYELRDNAIVVSSPVERSIPLTELQKAEWIAPPSSLNAIWFGQDGEDLTSVGSAEEGNGIRDCHVQVLGLAPGKALKQASVILRSPVRVWRLDPKKTPHWRVALKPDSAARVTDLYFEPPAGDAFEREFEIVLGYQDGTVAKTSLTATTHTSDQQKSDAVGPDGQSVKSPTVTLHFEGGGILNGKLVAMSEETLTLEAPWATPLEIPLLQVRGLLTTGAKKEVVARFEQAQKQAGSDDLALLEARDKGMAEVTGRVQSMADGQIQFHYDGESRSIKADRLLAIVFAAHPPVRAKSAPYQVLRLASGESLSGEWIGLKEQSISFRTKWGQDLEIPQAQVKDISGRNGRLVYLSDLEPTSVEQIPYFGRSFPYQRDQSLLGKPLKIAGKGYSKGLAVHSRTVLTYDLDGAFASFKALVGFDDGSKDRGRVVCRVLADGKELFLQNDLRSNQEPVEVDVPIHKARQLTLEVDFGEEEDVGDRVIWAMPRLYRTDPAAPEK